MRTIKFRAWDDRNNEMIVKGFAIRCENNIYSGEFLDGIDNDLWQRPRFDRLDKMVLMQFTGLKDVNGKEIYEGDVIVAHGKETETTTGEKRMVVDDAFNCYAALRDSILDKESPEIIGNLHENPDLLTQPQS